jgi:hypothetical protein
MSEMGQKQTLRCGSMMSGLPPKADVAEQQLDVRFVPIRDIWKVELIRSRETSAAALTDTKLKLIACPPTPCTMVA